MHDIHLVAAAALSVQERIGQLLGGALAPQVSRKLLLERQLSALALVHDDDLLKTAVASAVNALPVDLLDDLGEDMPGTCCPCVASRISYRGGGGVVGQQLVKGALATIRNGNCLIDAVLASKEAQGDAVLVGNRCYVRGMQNELRYELVDQLEARAYDLLPPYLQVAVEAKTLAECVSKWNNFSVEEYVQSARRIGYDTRSGGARFNSLDTVMLVVLGVVDGSACVVHCAYSGQYKFQIPGLDTRPTTHILFQAPKCGGSVGHWLGFSGSYTSSAVLPHTPLPPLNGGGLSLDSSSSELPLDWDDAYVAAFDYLDSDDEQPYEPVWSYFELNKVMKHRTRKVCKHRRSGSCVCCVEYDGQLSDSPISPLLSRRHRARKRTPVRHDVGHWPGFSPICTSESAQFPHVPLRGGGDAAIDANMEEEEEEFWVCVNCKKATRFCERSPDYTLQGPVCDFPCTIVSGKRKTRARAGSSSSMISPQPSSVTMEVARHPQQKGAASNSGKKKKRPQGRLQQDVDMDEECELRRLEGWPSSPPPSLVTMGGARHPQQRGASSTSGKKRPQGRLQQDVDGHEECERIESWHSSTPAPRQDISTAAVALVPALVTPEAQMPRAPSVEVTTGTRKAIEARITTIDVKDLQLYLLARNKQLLVRLMSATQRTYENERGTGTVASLLVADHTSDVEMSFWNMPALFDRLRVGAVYCTCSGSNTGFQARQL